MELTSVRRRLWRRAALWADEFAAKVKRLAERGQSPCYSSTPAIPVRSARAVHPQFSVPSVLRNAVNLDNVTVLTSSEKDELSQELPAWGHGAFTPVVFGRAQRRGGPRGSRSDFGGGIGRGHEK